MYGYMAYNVTSAQLIKAMKDKGSARKYYKRLIGMAPDEKEAEIIEHFYEDETKHLSKFRMLFEMTTGKEPEIGSVNTPEFESYIEGIEHAIPKELEACEFYRDIYLASSNPIVRDVFFEALTDENEHAVYLNYLYTKNKNR
jgi:rubrerythrin